METGTIGLGYYVAYVVVWVVASGAAWWAARQRVGPSAAIVAGILTVGGLGALAVEGYYLFAADYTDRFGYLRLTDRWMARHVERNAFDVRDAEWTAADSTDPGRYRIVLVGDGAAFGQGIERPADRFGELLETRLNARTDSLRYEVVTLAEPGWDTDVEIRVVEDVPGAFNPDELILLYSMDDAGDLAGVREMVREIEAGQPGWRRWLRDRSLALDVWLGRSMIRRGMQVRGAFVRDAYDESIHRRYQVTRIAELLSVPRRFRVPVRVAILPMLDQPWGQYSLRDAHTLVARAFRDRTAEVLDLFDVLSTVPPRDLWASGYDTHLNERGHALVADAMMESWFSSPDTEQANDDGH